LIGVFKRSMALWGAGVCRFNRSSLYSSSISNDNLITLLGLLIACAIGVARRPDKTPNIGSAAIALAI
jgi:hypothetical protein